MSLTLDIHAMTINNHPYGCPECGTSRFRLDTEGPLAAWPARGNCTAGCTWEDQLITNAIMQQIREARTGRAKAEDDDTFEIQLGSTTLAGTLAPELTVDDLRVVSRVYWRRIAKPFLRRKKNAARRAAVRPVKQAVGAATSAALGAAWQAQAGGWDEQLDTAEPANPCGACEGAGEFLIETRIHSKTGAGRIRCTICAGTGEAP
jgi:hypothetical protein